MIFFSDFLKAPNAQNETFKLKNGRKKFRVGLNASVELPELEAPKKLNISQVAKELKDFGIHSLKEEKHLEAVPLDRHGRANPHFHREIFLGNHELFENDIQRDEDKRNEKLKQIFSE